MTGVTFNHLLCILPTMFVLQSRADTLAFTCGITVFTERLAENEGSFSKITCLLNVTETASLEQTSIVFEVCQKNTLTTQCTFTWRTRVNDMTVRNWGLGNQTSCSCERLDLSQSMLTWKLTISLLVDRSLSVMHLYINNVEKTGQTIYLILTDVLYPSRITSLAVDGQEADSTSIIDKGQKVNISCFYDQGNPPEKFRLVDKHGNELGGSERSLTYSLSAQCEDDWPTVRCEGYWSGLNRSVSFVVRCPPQFVDNSVNIVTAPDMENVALPVKTHTTAITECYLTLSSLENSFRQEVNCTLTGNPPNLVLAFPFNEVKIARGNWTVTLGNEMGSTNTTISITKDGRETDSKFSEQICEEAKNQTRIQKGCLRSDSNSAGVRLCDLRRQS